jgi:hypothetical protein
VRSNLTPVLALLAIASATSPASADTFVAPDVTTLILGIHTANANAASENVIVLSAGQVYELTAATSQDPAYGDTGLPAIGKSLTIEGNGATILRAPAASPFRLLHVAPGATLHLRDTIVSGGSAEQGGAILNTGGTLHLTRATVTSSTATGPYREGGGGVLGLAPCRMTITDSTIRDNATVTSGAGGGGVASACALEVRGSTFSGNQAAWGGGGLYVFQETAAQELVVITNSTFSGNTAFRDGGGLLDASMGVHLGFVTITDNTTIDGYAGGAALNGGGTLRGSIIAGNFDPVPDDDDLDVAPDCIAGFDPVVSRGHNVIGNNDGCAIAAAAGDLIGTPASPVAPVLGPLAQGGGPTETHALYAGSPAADRVPAASCVEVDGAALTADQRGEPRPMPAGGHCDSGAVEEQEPRAAVCGNGVVETGEACDDLDDAGNPCCTGCQLVTGACDDGDACTEGDVCLAGGVCAGAPRDCDDGNACTTDSCDPASGCVRVEKVCPNDLNYCNGDERCNTVTGACEAGAPPICDDNDPCTADGCDPFVTNACVVSPLPDSDGDGVCDAVDGCPTAPGDRCEWTGSMQFQIAIPNASDLSSVTGEVSYNLKESGGWPGALYNIFNPRTCGTRDGVYCWTSPTSDSNNRVYQFYLTSLADVEEFELARFGTSGHVSTATLPGAYPLELGVDLRRPFDPQTDPKAAGTATFDLLFGPGTSSDLDCWDLLRWKPGTEVRGQKIRLDLAPTIVQHPTDGSSFEIQPLLRKCYPGWFGDTCTAPSVTGEIVLPDTGGSCKSVPETDSGEYFKVLLRVRVLSGPTR